MEPEKHGRFLILHEDAEHLHIEGQWPEAEVDVYRCPNCQHIFRVELPQ